MLWSSKHPFVCYDQTMLIKVTWIFIIVYCEKCTFGYPKRKSFEKLSISWFLILQRYFNYNNVLSSFHLCFGHRTYRNFHNCLEWNGQIWVLLKRENAIEVIDHHSSPMINKYSLKMIHVEISPTCQFHYLASCMNEGWYDNQTCVFLISTTFV